MGVTFSVSVKRRGDVMAKIRAMSGAKVEREIAREAGNWTLSRVQNQFNTQRDPYGRKWRKKKKSDGRKVLTGPTGKLRRNIPLTVRSRGFRLTAQQDYASFLQGGTKHMKPRLIFPDQERGLPVGWQKQYRSIAFRAIRRAAR